MSLGVEGVGGVRWKLLARGIVEVVDVTMGVGSGTVGKADTGLPFVKSTDTAPFMTYAGD